MTALGAALQIPKSALDAIDAADKKLKDIQATASATATSVSSSFSNMATGTKPFIDALDQIIAKLGTISNSAANAGSGLGNLSQGLGNVGSGASKAVQDLNNLVNQLSNIGGNGTGGIMQAVLAFKRLSESTKGASGMNIAEIKKEIQGIEAIINDTSYKLSKADQDNLIKRKKTLQDELKYQQQMDNERVISFQKALDRMASAQQSYANKQRKQYADRSKQYQADNHEQNTTYQGALNFSASANTLNRQVRAIEYLKEARMKLSQTDADYKQKLAALNAAIDHHNQKLKEAGINSRALAEQTSYLAGYMSRWAQRMAFAFSVGSIKSFVEQVADVRGQFELSERSLEAILQNKPKADEIFNKTVELAVISPFRIKDLVDYTRQLSAYRIESDKLYDTTKRLADVSAGLGVDMGRLILAYGQVKAAAYLRGSEVRQFTEAGINMYGELQQYFKEVKGEAYTTEQIVDMISKRMVTFADVEAIFQRMTDKGGTFYNMQEIQAETLQGKISNLKDAFDVMLNDIGKANEGTFKWMIGRATSLLDNWQAIVAAGKALAAVLLILQLQAVRTGTSLSQIFSSVIASSATKNVATLQLLKSGFKSAGAAAVTFGENLKYALASNAWLIAIAALVQALWSAGEAIASYYDKVGKAKEETIKTQGAIGTITSSYDQLAKSASAAGEKMAGKNLEKNIEDRRAQLQKLIDLAAKDGLTFTINVDTIKDKDLDAKFDEIKKKYKNFVDDIEVIERNYAKNNNWDTWFTDGLDDDANDYKNAVVDILSMSSQMEQAVAVINANYDKAKEETKEYFDIIRAGQKDGESNLDYWKRMSDALQQINRISTGSDYSSPAWAADAQANIKDMIQGFEKVEKKAKELKSEFNDVFGDLRKKYNNDPVQIKAVIDKTAAQHDWNQYERDLAYRHFGLKVNIDKDDAAKQVNWVSDYLTDFFAKKKYGINLMVKEITDDKALENFLDQGDKAAKAAKNWQELEKRIAAVGKNTKTIKVDDTIRKMFKAGDTRVSGDTVEVSTLKTMVKEYKKAATTTALGLGVDPFEKQNTKAQKEADKQQRDILQERISLLKDMNSKYDELLSTESQEQALSSTRKYFKEATQNVGWSADDILPDDASIAKRIRQLGATAKEVAKRGGYLRIAADIEWKISKEQYTKLKENIARNIEEAFAGLDLYKKLKEEGLSDTNIKSMFGNIAKSFDDIRQAINDEFNQYITRDYEEKYGKDYAKWGDDIIKQHNLDLENTAKVLETRFKDSDILKEYKNQVQKLDKQIHQDQVSQAQELLKNYKTNLAERLQLDKWYYEELSKIQSNTNFSNDKEMQSQMVNNLKKQFQKKVSDLDWKDFQNSDVYVSIFQNLDNTSTKAIDYMIDRLAKMKEQLKGLDPTQVKAIAEQMEKLQQTRDSRNPFRAFTSGLKEMIKAGKDFKKLGGIDAWVTKNKQNDTEQEDIKASEDRVAQLEAEVKQAETLKGLDDEHTQSLKLSLNFEKATLSAKKQQNKTTQQQVTTLNNAKDASEKAKTKFSNSVSDITTMVSSMGQAFTSLAQSLGMSDSYISDSINLLDHAGQLVGSIYSKNWSGVVSNAVGVIGDVVNLFTNESAIDEQLESLQRSVSSLQHGYEKLKKAMDDAFDTANLYDYEQKSIEALKAEQKAYQAMIIAEQDRKDPDQSKIQEWAQQIEDLDDTITELGETMTETLGGFGSQANYKSAAEAFAEAWVDAFNEGSDALDALNDKFDEYIQNLITKQATQRVVGRMLEPLLQMIDQAVSEGSEGGHNGLDLTKAELAKIKEKGAEVTTAINEALTNLTDVLELKPSGSSNISSLQQGIQSVTESTAQALESVLNSMRYYLATQQADVRIIRDTLLERLGTSINSVAQDSSNSPVLVELRLQTTILTDIRDTLDACVKTGHKTTRKGFGVFMN